jgi:hypothetical protein
LAIAQDTPFKDCIEIPDAGTGGEFQGIQYDINRN